MSRAHADRPDPGPAGTTPEFRPLSQDRSAPPPRSVEVCVDGRSVEVAEGESLAVPLADAGVPSVCFHPSLGALETCDTCLVEADGELVRACATPARAGLEVSTGGEGERAREEAAQSPVVGSRYPGPQSAMVAFSAEALASRGEPAAAPPLHVGLRAAGRACPACANGRAEGRKGSRRARRWWSRGCSARKTSTGGTAPVQRRRREGSVCRAPGRAGWRWIPRSGGRLPA